MVWTEQESITTDWFGNIIDPPIIGLLLEEESISALLLEGGDPLLLED